MPHNLPVFEKCFKYVDAAQARAAGWYPYFRPITKAEGSHVIIEGRELLMFGSNNYLGLALDPRVRDAAIKAITDYGTSCSGSRFMNGTLDLHSELEERLTAFTGKEAALCFTTGYQVNLGTISALVGRGEHIFSDKFNHASIMDGIFMARGFAENIKLHRYKHNNMDDLENKLKRVPNGKSKLIVTDGVFSMEGDIVKLPELRALARKHNAAVYLDEAHAVGVLGQTGRGTTEYYGDPDLADLVMCTFSKSLGSIGGYVAGNAEVIDFIKHYARPLIFSASMPPANVASAMKALEIMQEEPERVHRLQEIAKRMITGFKERGFDIGKTETPIVPLVTGTRENTIALWTALFNRGIYANPVLPPAVAPNNCLIRTSYMATHKDEELDYFLDVATEEAEKLGILGSDS